MKGDLGFDVTCPFCGRVVRPRSTNTNQTTRTPNTIIRHAMREHFGREHAGLSVREVSVLLDQIVEKLEARP